MKATTLSVNALGKRYGRVQSVDSLTFECEPGTVTAFLGPNGSGKSTSLRMIVGLTRPDSGTATFNGRTIRELPDPGRTVGVLLDAAAQHPGRSVIETVRLACILIGMPTARIGECLEFVGLGTAVGKRVGTLSLGMRQRLGLAIALLGRPSCLILDEPANGLDPEGISWLGRFLREFAMAGGTVLLSSHQLEDVDMVASHFIILDSGRVVYERSSSDERTAPVSLFTARDPAAILFELDRRQIAWEVDSTSSQMKAATDPETIWRISVERGSVLSSLGEFSHGGIRDVFLDSTSPEFRGSTSDFGAGRNRKDAKE